MLLAVICKSCIVYICIYLPGVDICNAKNQKICYSLIKTLNFNSLCYSFAYWHQ